METAGDQDMVIIPASSATNVKKRTASAGALAKKSPTFLLVHHYVMSNFL